ncbi:HotDog domain-containing protein [Annulohypoxylon bovei var. microspora]|nr:HotDog domain-containing protein [Annulohypoxylon bovei var. microspora]
MQAAGHRTAQVCLRSAVRSRRLVQANPSIRICRASPAASQFRHFASSRRLCAEPPKTPDPISATAAATSPLPPSQPAPAPAPDSASPPHRPHRRRLFYSAAFLILGLGLGTALRFTLAPPTPPLRGSDEDQYLAQEIRTRGSSLPLVQALSSDPSWTSWDAYSGFSSSPTATRSKMVQSRITSGPLSGSRGLPFQRIFHHASSGEVVSVLYFGSGTGGWPGVVHGGALATLLDESLGRCAILRFPARTGVTARLELSYRRPTTTSGFYVIRARPMDDERDTPEKRERKLWVEGTLETVDGRTCVEAKALFVVPKGVKLKPLVEGF